MEIINLQQHHFDQYVIEAFLTLFVPSGVVARNITLKQAEKYKDYGLDDEKLRNLHIETLTKVISAARRFKLRSIPDGTPDIICAHCVNPECVFTIYDRINYKR
jgi:hypothetical protein